MNSGKKEQKIVHRAPLKIMLAEEKNRKTLTQLLVSSTPLGGSGMHHVDVRGGRSSHPCVPFPKHVLELIDFPLQLSLQSGENGAQIKIPRTETLKEGRFLKLGGRQ